MMSKFDRYSTCWQEFWRAVNCANRYIKGSVVMFFAFPVIQSNESVEQWPYLRTNGCRLSMTTCAVPILSVVKHQTFQIALIVHVERTIGKAKNYRILSNIIPISVARVASEIFVVCWYLTNFLPHVVDANGQY